MARAARVSGAAHGGQVLVTRFTNRLDESLRLCEKGLAQMRSLGDKAGQGLLLGSLASFWQQISRLDLAIGLYEEALALYREVDSPRLECECLINVGLLNQEAGRFDEAEAHLRRSLGTMERTGDGSQEGYSLGFLAGLEFERGRLGAARDLYLEAVRALGRVGERFIRLIFLASLGGCLAQADDLPGADVTLGAAERLAAQAGSVPVRVVAVFRGMWHLAHARRLSAEGEARAASEHLALARSKLELAHAPLDDCPVLPGTGERGIDQSEDVRFAARLLEKALDAALSASSA